MLNIVIPMAGRGSRFSDCGYKDPKPLISINNKHMIEGVIDNLTPSCKHRFIFICQKKHIEKYNLTKVLRNKSDGCVVIPIEEYTEGAACTVLLAKEYICNSDPVMIANSDQWIDIDINKYLNLLEKGELDGLIMTMTANDPKWSFVGISNNKVNKVVEKEVISDEATVGIYNFSRGDNFCKAANTMIKKDKRVNGEFYVAPVYNQLINEKYNVGFFNIGGVNNGMYGLGTPDDLNYFKGQLISSNF